MGGRSLNSSGTFWGKKGLFGTDYLAKAFINRPGRGGGVDTRAQGERALLTPARVIRGLMITSRISQH